MKYEAVFGDQSLFDGAPEGATHATKGGGFYKIENMSAKYVSYGIFNGADVLSVGGYLIAERRIIPEPKRWTVEDKKAGRLPEVGCSVLFTRNNFKCEVIAIDDSVTEDVELALRFSDGSILVCKINKIKPIETPEEKAQRLREEWCSNALDSASILSGMREYDLKRLGGYIGNIYDALLSGDLPVPVKE